MSGDPRRGATIRRSLTQVTALASVQGSTSDSASAVGAAGAGAAGVGAGARTGLAALWSSKGPSSYPMASAAAAWRAGLPAERRGSTTQATGWGFRPRTVDLPPGISQPHWLPGARWHDLEASIPPDRAAREAGTALDPGRRPRTEAHTRRRGGD